MLGTPTDPGIVPRAVRDLFDHIAAEVRRRRRSRRELPSAANPMCAVLRRYAPISHSLSLPAQTARSRGGTEYLVRVSYLEVYNEEINDLLQPLSRGRGKNLKVRASVCA